MSLVSIPIRARVAVLLLLCGAVGCKEQAPPAPADEEQGQSSSLPAISVKAGARLLLTHATAEGTFATVDALDQVPEGRRGWVRVVDLNVKPQQRRDHELVYVADLRSPRKDGTYPYVVMSRAAFESAALNLAGRGATDPPPRPKDQTSGDPGKAGGGAAAHGQVILYSTSWCGACRAARAWLDKQEVAYVEKDIEKDQQAAEELLAKARAAGISASGVPVIDVGGTLVQGFDAGTLERLIADMKRRNP